MNFDLSEDQELLKALAERFVAGHCDLDRRRLGQASDHGFLPENWALLDELGLIAAPFAPDDGGMGLGANDLATVFEALGRGLAIEPLIENVLVGGCLFAATARAWLCARHGCPRSSAVNAGSRWPMPKRAGAAGGCGLKRAAMPMGKAW